MTIALEPKLIFPGKGVVGIENTHVVTQDGLERLANILTILSSYSCMILISQN